MNENSQINKNAKHKFDALYKIMAGHVAQNWNTILPSLLRMHKKLVSYEVT